MEAPSVPIGSQIGVYRIESMIGSGGMGSVYRAVHVRLGRKAAIKVLADPLAADPSYVSRFFHEARIVSEVRHPNIVDVVDFIESDSPRRVAYVMELVDGPPLSHVLRTHRLSPQQVINISLQLLDVLIAVHRINVIHRDLKPDNILLVGSIETDLSAKPCVKVLDFGIAKIQSPDAVHRTTTGMLMGTPAYMSPEQCAGEPVSPATDVYAFGEILYEMLTGSRLFQGNGRAILKAKVGDYSPTFQLPEDLDDRQHFTSLIRACLAPEQIARPSVPKLIENLKGLQGGNPAITPVMHRPQPQPVPYQPTLSGVVHTSVVTPPKSKAPIYATIGLAALIASGLILAMVMGDPQPAMVKTIPLEDSKPAIQKPIVEATPPSSPIVAPPPAEATPAPQRASKKGAKRAQKKPPKPPAEKQDGPLKKGEFPTW